MKNGEQTAFACCNEQDIMYGLTKREYIAAMAMQGLLSNPHDNVVKNHIDVAKVAILCADSLLKYLDKPISTTED